MAKQITSENFDAVIASELPAVILFSASWCGPCKMVKPIMEKLAEEMGLNYFLAVLDEDPALAQRLGIRNVPQITTYVRISDSLVNQTLRGSQTEAQIRDFLTKSVLTA